MNNFLFLLFVVFNFIKNYNCLECTIAKNNLPGTCQDIRNCEVVWNEFLEGKRDFTECEGRPNIIYICCPLKSQSRKPKNDQRTEKRNFTRIHEQKCNEYSEKVFEISFATNLAVFSEKKVFKKNRCGILKEDLITGGVKAKALEFPHMALLGYKNSNGNIDWNCGGSLISERFILTAAHCIKKFKKPVVVRIGELDIDSDTDGAMPEDIGIEKIIKHQNYSSRTLKNDIALIKLERDILINHFKRPACLPSSYDWDKNFAIASGWGNLHHTSTRGTNHLQKVRLDKFSERECNDRLINTGKPNHQLPIKYDTQICLGSNNSEKDTCDGDSGSPLQIIHPDEYCMHVIVGVTSFGDENCGTIGIPGVFTRVYNYIDWIEGIVWYNTSLRNN